MADDDMPPANLILQALHAIRAEAVRTNERLDQTNQRLDQAIARIDTTNQRIDALREFTVSGLTALNNKVDGLGTRLDNLAGRVDVLTARVDAMGSELHQLNDRFEHFLTGEGARLVRRMDSIEDEVKRIAAKVDH